MKRVLFILSFLLLLAGCEPETILNVPTSPLEFTQQGGNISVSFVANKVWTANSSASWCKVSPTSGDGSGKNKSNITVTLTCDPNPDYDVRTCDLTITCQDLSATIKVNQAAANGLLIDKTDYEVSSKAQQIEVNVRTNVDYSATSHASWIKVVSTKGLTDHTLTLSVDENTTYEDRTGTVTVKDASGTLSSTVTVKQTQNDYMTVTPDQDVENVTTAAQNLTFTVKSNVDYEVSFANPENPGWIEIVSTKGIQTNKITLKVDANEGLAPRYVDLVVKSKGGDITLTKRITQVARKDIVLSKEEVEIPWEGIFTTVVSIDIESSVDYTVFADKASEPYIESIKAFSTSSPYRKEWRIAVKGNDEFVERTLHIVAQADDKSITKTLTIKQLAPEIKIEFNGQPSGGSVESQVGADAYLYMYVYPEELLDYGYELTVKEPASGPMPIRLEEDTEAPLPQWKVYSICEGQTAISVKFKKTGSSATLNWDVQDFASADPKTRQALVALGVDTNYNGIFEDEEIEAVKKLTLSGDMENIYDVNIFYNLEELTLEDMPLFKASYWDFNLEPCQKLKKLAIHGTVLLEAVNVNNNKELVELDLSDNPDNHVLNDIVTNGLPKLEKVVLSNTPVKEWGVYDNPAIRWIEADNCGLTNFGAFGNDLEYVSAKNNQLSGNLVLGDVPKLKEAHFDNNKFDELWFGTGDVPVLQKLTVNNNALKAVFNINEAKELVEFECAGNQLKSLEVHENLKLKVLRCLDNPMEAIMIRAGQVFSVFEVPKSATIYEVSTIVTP